MTTTEWLVTEPGVYPDMPEDVYLSDPVPAGSLSTSGARMLLPPSCPAKYRYWQDNPRPPKTAFDLGHAAHHMLLGSGAPLVVIDAADWRTKAAKEQRDQAYADGHVPLLAADHERVVDMARVAIEHPIAGALFDPTTGQAEVSVFWVDGPTGVYRRARYDFLRHPQPGRRRVIVDYKTCDSADPDHIQRALHNYGYHMQGAAYIDGAIELDLGGPDTVFVLAFQETAPPHVITVVQLDPIALRIGRDLNREALEIYAECSSTGRWPGYSDDIELIALPTWVERQHTKEIW